MKAAAGERFPCGGFAVKAVECGALALPAFLDIADASIEPIVLRHLDIVFGCEAADGACKLINLGFAPCDAVLSHRWHTGGVDSFDEVHHLRQVCFSQLNALGVSDRKRFAHGGNKAAALLGARLRGAFPHKKAPA